MSSGEHFECQTDKSILDAAHAAGVLISYGCRNGQCGSCMGRVIAGEITYRNGLPEAISLAEAEAGQVLFCSAYAATDLIIEVINPEL